MGGAVDHYLDAMNTANNEIAADRNNLLNIMDEGGLQGQEYLVNNG